MKIRNKEIDLKHLRKVLICVGIGTAAGLGVYGIFLYFHIDIFGWNLGLIFAPLVAGYVETIFANKLIGENVGAISAFILFIDTTFYSFILKNPTLGWNLITAGSIIVILQAAFPTLINYILLVVIGGLIAQFINTIKTFVNKIKLAIKNRPIFYWEAPEQEINVEPMPFFDEKESNEKLNSLNFFFITSNEIPNIKSRIIGLDQSEVILDKKKRIIHTNPELSEQQTLQDIKEGKDECLIRLVKQIKDKGGNGILDLTIHYNLIGLNGDNIQITATGIGICIE